MNKKKENNFESALKRLEEISDLLENEDTPLAVSYTHLRAHET